MNRRTIGGRYELDPLSRQGGGMGEVWFGYDKKLDRAVAVKFIRIDRLPDGKADREATDRFVRESRITARLAHPGVPAVYDCGTQDEDLYLVMEQIKGCSVTSLIDETEVPVAWAAAIAAQVCAVLTVAHDSSLVHRDLKPANLMLCPDGTVKVLDFGIAIGTTSSATRLTRTGFVVGTPEYMAPEQALAGSTTPQSDLYSLGVILDEMLTGKNQFVGPTHLATLRNHMEARPLPVRRRRPGVPEDLENLILWMLAKTSDARPSSAEEIYGHLLGHCRDLPPFPGYVDASEPPSIRMYAQVINGLGKADTAPLSSPPGEQPAFNPADLTLARKDARALKDEARFTQAAEVLAAVVEPATRALGAANGDVLSLRAELAELLFLGGDYRRAAQLFAGLTIDVTDADEALRLRQREAGCNAAAGETALALRQLNELLEDERRLGAESERVLELRRQIGLLELGVGDKAAARRTLEKLLPDMERHHGPAHPAVARIREILGGL
ncbi:protein kinase [Nonomuraea sp. NPDC059023]|uniref:serine/threonine-protein kinase n=1 Tax=unclassified Nonomuraea TaxID=2593643 RepID=UPI0036CD70C8